MSDKILFDNLLLSAGVMKAGTTWLYAVLAHHPELHITLEKEIHYFYHRYVAQNLLSDTRRLHRVNTKYLKKVAAQNGNKMQVQNNLSWMEKYLRSPVDDQWYRDLFSLRPKETYACDFSNLSMHLPEKAWPQISALCGNLRVLLTMRDPIKRLWSHTKFQLQMSGELDKLDHWKPRDYESFARQKFLWRNNEYGAALKRISSSLPRDSWMPLYYEELHADQRGTLRNIESFLGIAHHAYPDALLTKKRNVSASLPMPDFFPDFFAADVKRIKSELTEQGFPPPASWL